jgi:hypothetical protein
MSYSFTITATTKAEAKERVAAEFDKVVTQQPAHVRDRASALAAAGAFLDLIADDESKDFTVTVNGSVSWQAVLEPGNAETIPLTAAAVSVSAYQAHRA